MHLANDPTGRRPRPARRSRWRAALAAATSAAVVGALLTTTPAAAIEPAADGAYRFDFGTATSPVATGYQQALTTSLYTAQAGWGVTVPAGVTLFDRYRAGSRTPADPLAEDFVAGTTWGFNVDLADGEYDVTVTIGDSLTTASGTNATVTLEGAAQTRADHRARHQHHRDLPHRRRRRAADDRLHRLGPGRLRQRSRRRACACRRPPPGSR